MWTFVQVAMNLIFVPGRLIKTDMYVALWLSSQKVGLMRRIQIHSNSVAFAFALIRLEKDLNPFLLLSYPLTKG